MADRWVVFIGDSITRMVLTEFLTMLGAPDTVWRVELPCDGRAWFQQAYYPDKILDKVKILKEEACKEQQPANFARMQGRLPDLVVISTGLWSIWKGDLPSFQLTLIDLQEELSKVRAPFAHRSPRQQSERYS